MPASADHDPDAGLIHEATYELMDAYGISQSEALARLEMQEAKPVIGKLAVQLYPSTFTAVWIDHEAGGDVYIGFTEDAAAATAAVASSFPYPGRLHAVDTEYSMEYLFDLYEEFEDFYPDLNSSFPDLRGASLLPDEERIVVYASSADADGVQQTVEAQFPAQPVEVEVVAFKPVGAGLDCNPNIGGQAKRFHCEVHLRGGISLANALSGRNNPICTAGFMATNTIGDFYFFTAGHCADPPVVPHSTLWYHDGKRIGPAPEAVFSGSVDAARVVFDAIGEQNFDLTRWVFRHPNNQAPQVRAVQRGLMDDYFSIGDRLCKSGITTHETCGTLTSVQAIAVYFDETTVVYDQYEIWGMCMRPGDSGSPVYRVESNGALRAFGIGNVGVSDEPPSVEPCGSAQFGLPEITWATKIANAEAELDITVNTS